jgi:hypothetical protein
MVNDFELGVAIVAFSLYDTKIELQKEWSPPGFYRNTICDNLLVQLIA